ncbi:MAG TPA: metalloregulator ArsR/SmtB family transcription factor [Acidisarcina sp.]
MTAYLKVRLEATGDRTRLAILESLARAPQAVVDLASRFPISRPAVSQHLRILKDARLILSARDGRRTVYRADPDALAELRAHFDRMWSDALASFQDAAEAEAKPQREKEKKHGRKRHRSRKKRGRD